MLGRKSRGPWEVVGQMEEEKAYWSLCFTRQADKPLKASGWG